MDGRFADEMHQMIERWKALHAERNSAVGTRDELVRARDGAIVCDLSRYALLSFEGEDAETFLQGQLSSDVSSLTHDRTQLATYNSPKGRILATLLLWRTGRGFLMQLPATVGASICRRLSMYVLRSKVRVSLATDHWIRIGIGGPDAARGLTAVGIAPAQVAFGLMRDQQIAVAGRSLAIDYVMQLPGNRYELVLADAETAIALWRALEASGLTPAASTAWEWLTLSAGIAEVVAETQDQFVAQMLNYELIGGISFTKGCYPGQEIVARTQYRGSIKRRTLLAHADTTDIPAPGMAVFSSTGGEQAIGTIVNVAASPNGGFDLLMCAHVELAAGTLHLSKPEGPGIHVLPLPYPIPDTA